MKFDWRSYCTFSTARSVTIRDWRLGLLNHVFSFAILAYVVFNMVTSYEYYTLGGAEVLVNSWGSGFFPDSKVTTLGWGNEGRCDVSCETASSYDEARGKMKALAEGQGASVPEYCLSNDQNPFRFRYDSEFTYGVDGFKCEFLPAQFLWKKRPNGALFFNTHTQRTIKRSFRAESFDDAACASRFQSFGETSCGEGAVFNSDTGHCECTSDEFIFIPAVEHMAMAFEQQWVVQNGFESSNDDEVDESSPRTVIVESDRKTIISDSATGSGKLMLSDLLKVVGAELDNDNPRLAVDGVAPKFRLTGVTIELTFHFFNKGVYPLDFGELDIDHEVDKPISIVVVDSKEIWTSLGPEITHQTNPDWANSSTTDPIGQDAHEIRNNYKYGVNINMVEGVSRSAKLDPQSIVNALINGVVLIGVAGSITLFVAERGWFNEAPLYNAVINEEQVMHTPLTYTRSRFSLLIQGVCTPRIDFGRSVATFACQAIVAFYAYKQLDQDGNGIDRGEIIAGLKDLMKDQGDKMKQEDIETMARVLFEIGDQNKAANNTVMIDDSQRIDRAEFVDLFTDDRISFEMLVKIIKTSFREYYVDPKVQELGVQLQDAKELARIKNAAKVPIANPLQGKPAAHEDKPAPADSSV